jgi:sugar (pentulose or hexulose) kinase
VLGALGLGARAPGQVAYVAGTSTVILGVAGQPRLDPRHRFLVTPLAEPDRWGQEMDLLATGSALRWLAGLLGTDEEGNALDEAGVIGLAAQVDPGDAPVVLPYLSPGEQGALWDPALSGTVTGLTLAHDRRHLARGLVNGIVLESRRCLDVLAAAGQPGFGQHGVGQHGTCQHGADLLVAGGSAEAAAFRADLADATGRRVILPSGHSADSAARSADFSALGAALVAARAAGSPLPGGPEATGRPGGPEASGRPGGPEASGRPGGPEASGPPGGPEASGRPGRPGAAGVITDPDPGRAALWDRLWAAHERSRRAISLT